MNSPRDIWIHWLLKIANPVFDALADCQLHAKMPIEHHPLGKRNEFVLLESVGRALAGIGPWLENTDSVAEETSLRLELTEKVIAGLRNGVDPESPDFMNFSGVHGHQPLVDAAFLSHGLLRSWNSVWLKLDEDTCANIITCLKHTRQIRPPACNWLLFSAMIEAFLCRAGADWDPMRVDYALRQHEQWYRGDGAYGDGPAFHWDYYNSFVIQPMLRDIVQTVSQFSSDWQDLSESIDRRLVRYAVVQERMISPEGTYPPLGRSLAYRIGAFQALSQVALQGLLPDDLAPSSVRCALTAVLERQFKVKGTFDDNGWLKIGFCGAQPSMGEVYITTGSLYLCLCGFLHLGLPANDRFWTAPDTPWTAKRAWAGEDLPCDHAIHD